VWQRASAAVPAAAEAPEVADGDGEDGGGVDEDDGEEVGAEEADAGPAAGGADGPHPANPAATSTDSPMSARMHPPDESPRTVLDQVSARPVPDGDTPSEYT